MHCANMSYMYRCLGYSYYQGAKSLLVKICLQVKINFFFSDVIVTSV